jgi:hypothetical protein
MVMYANGRKKWEKKKFLVRCAREVCASSIQCLYVHAIVTYAHMTSLSVLEIRQVYCELAYESVTQRKIEADTCMQYRYMHTCLHDIPCHVSVPKSIQIYCDAT